jgi:hypothetical protein
MIKKKFCLSALTFIIVVGGEGYRVEKPEELDKALERAFESDKPAILLMLPWTLRIWFQKYKWLLKARKAE